jgi:restriction system protein
LLIDNSGKQSLIQIKRRTKANATEGVEALRALIGTTVIEDNVRGCIFVSTADHFSKPAKDYASNVINKNIVDTFDLIDCKEFLRMADLVRDKLPDVWTKLLKL